MLKKYVYISILLGTFVLSGCTDNQVNNKEAKTEPAITEQTIVTNNEDNTIKTEETAPIPLNLTQEQKEEYYQKYVAILEKINAQYNENFELELEPITEYLDAYWIEVEDFEKLAKERANMSIAVLENSQSYHPMSVPKTAKLQIGSKEANIIFNGSFDTQLDFTPPEGRQVFSVFHSISSEAANGDGSWTQVGYSDFLIDSVTTYVIEVAGQYSQSGIISTHAMALEFYCDKYGGIS